MSARIVIALRVALTGVALVPAGASHPAVAYATTSPRPASRLAVLTGGEWREWWDSEHAPVRWAAPVPMVANAVTWRPTAAPGVEWSELRISGSGEAWRLRIILARIDPGRVRFSLEKALTSDSLAGAWTIDSAPASAVLAMDAGQFSYGRPWGLVVRNGVEEQPPGRGPLSTAVMFDSAGAISLATASEIPTALATTHPTDAFQSYPTLLTGDGQIPRALRTAGRGIDVGHRDSRLALGTLRDGRVLVALTRFDGLHGVLSVVPFGPTVPEMAAIMGALGCHDAVMLDGGISGQLSLRDSSGETRAWRGLRKVPMGIVGWTRDAL
jgi:hypothetical protein